MTHRDRTDLGQRAESVAQPNGVAFWRSLAIASIGLLLTLGTYVYTDDRTAGAAALRRVEENIDRKLSQFAAEARSDHELILKVDERQQSIRVRLDGHEQRIGALEKVVRP